MQGPVSTLHCPLTQSLWAQAEVPGGQALQIAGTGPVQSADVLHCPGGGGGGDGQLAIEPTHIPPEHQLFGQTTVPSAHCTQGAPSLPQSLSTLHPPVLGGGQGGKNTLQIDPSHLACAHTVVPSAHAWQTAGATQVGGGIGAGVGDGPGGTPPVVDVGAPEEPLAGLPIGWQTQVSQPFASRLLSPVGQTGWTKQAIAGQDFTGPGSQAQTAQPAASLARPFGQLSAGQWSVGQGDWGAGAHMQVSQPFASLSTPFGQFGPQPSPGQVGGGAQAHVPQPFSSLAIPFGQLSSGQLSGGQVGGGVHWLVGHGCLLTWQSPFTQAAVKPAHEPSAHCWQTVGTAQSPSTLQAGGAHPPSVALQAPATQETLGQALEPSAHWTHGTRGCGQSPSVWHWAPEPHSIGSQVHLAIPTHDGTFLLAASSTQQ
jgi:hypothetical protein